jgi:hypothetical protein
MDYLPYAKIFRFSDFLADDCFYFKRSQAGQHCYFIILKANIPDLIMLAFKLFRRGDPNLY